MNSILQFLKVGGMAFTIASTFAVLETKSFGDQVVVSVLETGAKGDGISDDTAAFQTALQRFKTDGGTLVLPRGTYAIRPETIVVTANICVRGSQATLKPIEDGFSLLSIRGSNISLSGITLDGSYRVVRGMTIKGGSSNVKLSNVVIQNFAQPSDANNPLAKQTAAGLRIEGNCTDIVIEGSTVKDVTARTKVNLVSRGIWITPVTGERTSKNIIIRNCSFQRIGPKDDGDGIVIQDSDESANLTISNCTFDRCHKRAIKIQVPGATIVSNRINNAFLGDNRCDVSPGVNPFDMYSAISVYKSDVTVCSNLVTGVGSFYCGIEIGAAAPLKNITIHSNTVEMGTKASVSHSSLVRVMKLVDNLTITNNVLRVATWGIRMDEVPTRSDIRRNRINNVTYPMQPPEDSTRSRRTPRSR